MKKKVLVTGAEGFIGSHLVERLVQLGASVRAMVLYNSFNHHGWLESLPDDVKAHVEIVLGDVRDDVSVSNAVKGTEIVFHLAALIAIPYSYQAPASYVDTNIKGTLNILQAVREHGVARMVHTSTSETYGTAHYVPIDEEHPLQGQSPYSASKIGADMMALSYFLSFGTPVAVIRPFNTYGPRQSARAVIPTIISQLLAGYTELKLGSLEPTRDLNFVKDTVEGFIKVAESPKALGTVINIGAGKEISVGDLAQKIIALTGQRATIIADSQRKRPEGSEVFRLCADTRKAFDLTGWQPTYSLDQGLLETIAWIESNQHHYKPAVYNV